MHTQVHQRKLPLTALQGHDGVCESYAPSFNQKVSNFSTRSVHFGYSDCTSTQKSTPAIVTLKSYFLLILPTKIVLLVKMNVFRLTIRLSCYSEQVILLQCIILVLSFKATWHDMPL